MAWVVSIFERGVDDPVKTMKLPTERQALRVERGVGINLKHELFYTDVRYVDEAEQTDELVSEQ